MDDKYKNFSELKANEKAYRICYKKGASGVAIIAPHGGGIEPGTSEIAEGIAANEHTFYSFYGLMSKGNKILHITSENFDEPIGFNLVKQSEKVIAIHGCDENGKFVEIGGKDEKLKDSIDHELGKKGFSTKPPDPKRPGLSDKNICNKGKGKSGGIQIEMSKDLRDSMFIKNTREGRAEPKTATFEDFVSAIRTAIANAVT